ncbi:MAG: GMC family oxidoreductase [Gemmatimonadota bacterium]|nr:GMC family oxidoreductase [Gemmatimonadota bacterium]
MSSRTYEAIVIGSGLGGGAAAFALSRAGFRTLLLERGGWVKRDALDWSPRGILIDQRYRSRSPVEIEDDRGVHSIYPNEAVGGMSVFYGGASLRLREKDFSNWPVDYAAMEPYYTKAEHLLEVHGQAGTDIHEPPRSGAYPYGGIELTPPAKRIYEAAKALGHRPFKMPLALNFTNKDRPACIRCSTCDGFPCRIEAKNDVAMTLLAKAQAFDLAVMPGMIVLQLETGNGRVVRVRCLDGTSKRPVDFNAKIVILSAGALQSPAILLRSGLERLDNHRLVGRFLMRHCNAVVTGLFPFRTNPERVFHKQLCFTDFYEDLRERLGTSVGSIQDIYTPAPEVLKQFAPFGYGNLAAFMARYMQNLLCIAEDEPQFENRVHLTSRLDDYGIAVTGVVHRYSDRDRLRKKHLTDRARRILKQAGGLYHRIYNIETFSHAVGSLRFGNLARDSVLDECCRFRGIDNLFVLDGSFMPTSGGVNPSLTIAANALRVADVIHAEYG